MPPPLLTLTTDFSADDACAAILKGALYRLCPDLRLVDAVLGLPAHDRFAAAFTLLRFHSYYPPATIHLVAVDAGEPSPAGHRRGLVAAAAGQFFLAADNGVLGMVLARASQPRVFDLGPVPAAMTFAARDLLAPAAARLAGGALPEALGPPVADWRPMVLPSALVGADAVDGEVLQVDPFGNLLTNITPAAAPWLTPATPSGWRLLVGSSSVSSLRQGYGSVTDPDEIFALWGAEDWLEISVPRASAAQRLAARRGTKVQLRRASSPLFR